MLFLRLPESQLHAFVTLSSELFPHKHRACAVLSLRLPSSLHPFGFLYFSQFGFVMRALPNKLRFVQ